MVVSCCVIGCKSRMDKKNLQQKRNFFRIPEVCRQSPKIKDLTAERRRLWLIAINRKNFNTKNARICDRHFISGKKAERADTLNPDWVPSLHLGYNKKTNPIIAKGRYERQKKREERKMRIGLPAPAPCEVKAEPYVVFEQCMDEEYLEEYIDEVIQTQQPHLKTFQPTGGLPVNKCPQNMPVNNFLKAQKLQVPTHQTVGTQTDLTLKNIDELLSALVKSKHALDAKAVEIKKQKKEIAKTKMGIECFVNNDAKTRYFTGFKTFEKLFLVYKAIQVDIPDCLLKGLNSFHVLVLTLIKLRLDLPFTLLGYMFGISTTTASKKFFDSIAVVSSHLGSTGTEKDMYNKVCELMCESKHMQSEEKKIITFVGTAYPSFNKLLETFVNQTGESPKPFDVTRMLEFCNNKYSLDIPKEEIDTIAQDAFGKMQLLLLSRNQAIMHETEKTKNQLRTSINVAAASDLIASTKYLINQQKSPEICFINLNKSSIKHADGNGISTLELTSAVNSIQPCENEHQSNDNKKKKGNEMLELGEKIVPHSFKVPQLPLLSSVTSAPAIFKITPPHAFMSPRPHDS